VGRGEDGSRWLHRAGECNTNIYGFDVLSIKALCFLCLGLLEYTISEHFGNNSDCVLIVSGTSFFVVYDSNGNTY
jgi:hypothetical protein